MARRDPTGHLDPKYALDLHAFLHRPRSDDSLAEQRGEETVNAATGGGVPGVLSEPDARCRSRQK